MKNLIKEAAIIALAILGFGCLFHSAVDNFIDKDRTVTVKGLAEMEVKADKVIWPLTYKELGNTPSEMYANISAKNAQIVSFLTQYGIRKDEISINPPEISDRKAHAYGSDDDITTRYVATSVITVTSNSLDTVRSLMQRQSELMKYGIALTGGDYESGGTTYEYTRLNSIKPRMIEEATKNARATAEKFAKDSDSRLGKIKTASQGQFSIEDRDQNTSHIKNVRVVTTIEYYLKD